MTATYECGTSTITTSITGSEMWTKENTSREYFTMTSSGKPTKSIEKLYRIIAGTTRDQTVQVNGVTYGYILGIDFNSKTKRSHGAAAVRELVEQIQAQVQAA